MIFLARGSFNTTFLAGNQNTNATVLNNDNYSIGLVELFMTSCGIDNQLEIIVLQGPTPGSTASATIIYDTLLKATGQTPFFLPQQLSFPDPVIMLRGNCLMLWAFAASSVNNTVSTTVFCNVYGELLP